jgi:hypothetical protein
MGQIKDAIATFDKIISNNYFIKKEQAIWCAIYRYKKELSSKQ